MDPVTLALILGGTGVLKGLGPDKWKEDRERWSASQTQRYSPWTGLRAQGIQEADPLGAGIQGAVSGAAQGQNFAQAASLKKLTDAQTDYYGRGGAPDPYSAGINSAMSNGMDGSQAGPTTEAAKKLASYKNYNPYSAMRGGY